MKSIRRSISFILTTCLLLSLVSVHKINSQPVDAIQAKLVAKNFFEERLSRSRDGAIKGISSLDLEFLLVHKENAGEGNDPKKGSEAMPVYYIFNVKDKTNQKDKNGFIIVSADQRVTAILGYSFTEEFSENDQRSAFKDWMDHYKEQIVYVVENNLKPDPEVTDNWKKYSGKIELKGVEQLTEVTPLLSTKWNQNGYCNNLCPEDEDCINALNGHVPAGCVAVAMAQIMKHWNYPNANNPIPGYNSTNYGWQPDLSATTYNWSLMRDNIDFFNPDQPTSAQIEAVSTLIYHCGVSVQMKYGSSASGAGSPVNALIDYFKYSPEIRDVDRSVYSDSDWEDLLRGELNEERPVYYSGYKNEQQEEGHAFVCDGYQDVEPYFHFNWGLGPGPDGYYYLSDLTPGSHDFRFVQWAIIGITPGSGSGSAVTDIDGNIYNTVTIGEQTWMVENLKTTKYTDNSDIQLVVNNTAWSVLSSPAYCYYDNLEAEYKNTYGPLYNWYAVNTGKLCPTGWHVPTDAEWTILEEYLIANGYNYDGTTTGNKIGKALASSTLWISSSYAGSIGNTDYPEKRNVTGFSALPGGNHYSDGTFAAFVGWSGGWWSSTPNMEYVWTRAWYRTMYYQYNSLGKSYYDYKVGFSVRCLKGALAVETIPGDAGAFAYGFIGTPEEEKWYKFLTGLAGAYAIQTYGTTDTYMYLFDSDQTTLLAEDNDAAGSGNNSKIVQNLSANTWYYVKIRGYDNSVTGSYSINIVPLPATPTAENLTVCSDGTGNQTLTATATAPEGSTVVWFTSADGSVTTENPTQTGIGSSTYYAASFNELTGCYSLTRTPVTLSISALPTATISGPALICQGNAATLSIVLTGQQPWSIKYTDGIAPTNITGIVSSQVSISVSPGGTTTYSLISVNDANCPGNVSGNAAVVINSDPVITSITADPDEPVVLVDNAATVNITANFSDADNNLQTIAYDFGDGSAIEKIELNETDIMSQVSHTYFNPGVFEVNVTLTDDCGSVSLPYKNVIVFDPSGGFVIGAGWINSPAGAYVPGPALTGMATFGFEANYKKGAKNLTGKTIFQFHAARMNFKSTSYKWLVIAGSKAMFMGTGTINGSGKYGFMLTATDRNPDKLRIRIWDSASGLIVYDNKMNASDTSDPVTAISGGSIVIHKPKGKNNIIASDFGIKAYPNPFNDHIYFDISMMTDSEVILEIFDMDGSKIATIKNNISAYENYTIEYVPENLRSNILIYLVTINGKQMFSGRLIRH